VEVLLDPPSTVLVFEHNGRAVGSSPAVTPGGLQTVDLSTKGLKRLGLHRTDLIDTPVSAYPRTREWAEWLHGATLAKGLVWTSRQDDAARAVVLFGDRLAESAFKVEVDREPLCEDAHLDVLLELAQHIGIQQLFGL
jgi:hypothetical protein